MRKNIFFILTVIVLTTIFNDILSLCFGSELIENMTLEEANKIKAFTDELTKGTISDEEKVRIITTWIHSNFSSTFGNPKYKTLTQFFEKRKGNCYHRSVLLLLMLQHLKIPARFVNEIDYDSPGLIGILRELFGIVENVPCGMNHNNHVWIEAHFDSQWQPVDANYGVVGIEEWLEARLLSNRKRFPLIIYVLSQDGFIRRSEYYLIERFKEVCNINETQSEFIAYKEGILFMSQYNYEKGGRLPKLIRDRIGIVKIGLDELCRVNNLVPKKKWTYN